MHSYGALQPRWKITITITISHMFLPMLRGGRSLLLMMMMITISLIFTPSLLDTTSSIFQTAIAAQPLSLPSSLESTTIKVILSDSIQALKSGDTNKALHLIVADQKLATAKENSSSFQSYEKRIYEFLKYSKNSREWYITIKRKLNN